MEPYDGNSPSTMDERTPPYSTSWTLEKCPEKMFPTASLMNGPTNNRSSMVPFVTMQDHGHTFRQEVCRRYASSQSPGPLQTSVLWGSA